MHTRKMRENVVKRLLMFIWVFTLTTISTTLFAQDNNTPAKKIEGMVTNDKGEPVIGAAIKDRIHKLNAVTDVNGKFTIEAKSDRIGRNR